MDIAKYCHEQIGKMPCFRNYAKEVVNPLFIWMMDPEYDKKAEWTLFDLQAALQQSGWTADSCARRGLRALWRGRRCIVPDWWNRVWIPLCKILPMWVLRPVRRFTMKFQK